MQNILLIYEDNSVKILNMDEYIEYLMGRVSISKPVKLEIYREDLPGRRYLSKKGLSGIRRMSLSEFPEEIRSLILLYEI